ncbi:MAG: hypothetical protein JWN03_168 [Nocardia sp.]|nr:hypothetical protein [Nocardia sp.]
MTAQNTSADDEPAGAATGFAAGVAATGAAAVIPACAAGAAVGARGRADCGARLLGEGLGEVLCGY